MDAVQLNGIFVGVTVPTVRPVGLPGSVTTVLRTDVAASAAFWLPARSATTPESKTAVTVLPTATVSVEASVSSILL